MIYITSYCNKAHRTIDGKPIDHECRIIPPKALIAEITGDCDRAIEIMNAQDRPRYMRRGVKP